MSQPPLNSETPKQLSTSDRYTYETSHSAEIIGVALLVIGLISFIGVIIKSFNF